MPSTPIWAAVILALLPACSVGDEATEPEPEAESDASTALQATKFATPNLAAGEKIVWNFDGAAKAGIDPRFRKGQVKGAKNVSFKQGPSQQITVTASNEKDGNKIGQADVQLEIADIKATPGAFYKGWVNGNVIDSDNKAIGFCGDGGFEKGDFHTQVQLAFKNGGQNLGICYCNLCPAKDGHAAWCATDQWQVGGPNDGPKVSYDGACKAPGGTDHVLVTLEAVVKGDQTLAVHHRGTAVFKKVVVARCANDGGCESVIPNDYGN